MIVWYMAHPIAGDVEGNLWWAKRWRKWLAGALRDAAVVAPYVTDIEAGVDDDSVPEQRTAGLARNCAVAVRCDGILLVGGVVSAGMAHEAAAVRAVGCLVVDLTPIGKYPPGYCTRCGAPFRVNGWCARRYADGSGGCQGNVGERPKGGLVA